MYNEFIELRALIFKAGDEANLYLEDVTEGLWYFPEETKEINPETAVVWREDPTPSQTYGELKFTLANDHGAPATLLKPAVFLQLRPISTSNDRDVAGGIDFALRDSGEKLTFEDFVEDLGKAVLEQIEIAAKKKPLQIPPNPPEGEKRKAKVFNAITVWAYSSGYHNSPEYGEDYDPNWNFLGILEKTLAEGENGEKILKLHPAK